MDKTIASIEFNVILDPIAYMGLKPIEALNLTETVGFSSFAIAPLKGWDINSLEQIPEAKRDLVTMILPPWNENLTSNIFNPAGLRRIFNERLRGKPADTTAPVERLPAYPWDELFFMQMSQKELMEWYQAVEIMFSKAIFVGAHPVTKDGNNKYGFSPDRYSYEPNPDGARILGIKSLMVYRHPVTIDFHNLTRPSVHVNIPIMQNEELIEFLLSYLSPNGMLPNINFFHVHMSWLALPTPKISPVFLYALKTAKDNGYGDVPVLLHHMPDPLGWGNWAKKLIRATKDLALIDQ